MTTPSTERKAGPLLGTGAQTTWPFTFKVFAATDIAVTIADSLGVETALTYGVDYTVTLNANQETSPGGTVTYPISGSPLPTGSRLVIVGNLPYDQPLDLPSGGNFSPIALENELDRLTMQIQQLRERVGRALQVSVTTGANVGLPAPSANELIGWDSTGSNLQNFAVSELATAVAYATMRYDTFTGDGVETQFTLTADPVTLANLDVAISGVTQVPGSDYSLVNGVLVFASAPANGTEILARYGEGLVNVGGDSSDIRFLQAGNGAVDRTVEGKLREFVSVKDFGAVGDGVTDDTAAIQAAIAYCQSTLQSTNDGGGAYNGSTKTLYFPKGVYKITSALTADVNNTVIYMSFVGEEATLLLSPGVVCFGGVGYQVKFSNLSFRGGAVAISIKTANLDTAMIEVDKCEFWRQTTASIRTDSTSQSTLLNIANSKFANYAGDGRFLYIASGDFTHMHDCWLSAGCYNPIYFGAGHQLSLVDIVGVPYGDLTASPGTGHWIQNYGDVLHCERVRFGGEFAGAPIIYNYANLRDRTDYPWIGQTIAIVDCELYAGNSARSDDGVIIAKTGLPANIRITGCMGPISSPFIVDDIAGGMQAYLSAYRVGSPRYPELSIHITNNHGTSAPLSNTDGATNALLPFVVYEACSQTKGNSIFTAAHGSMLGREYLVTSSSGTTAIVDTGIYYNTGLVGTGVAAIYEVNIAGNPNGGASGSYNSPVIGQIIVATIFTGGSIKQQVYYQDTYNPIASFTVSATFWNGTSESVSHADGDTTYQLRLKIDGYNASYVGAGTIVRVTKKM